MLNKKLSRRSLIRGATLLAAAPVVNEMYSMLVDPTEMLLPRKNYVPGWSFTGNLKWTNSLSLDDETLCVLLPVPAAFKSQMGSREPWLIEDIQREVHYAMSRQLAYVQRTRQIEGPVTFVGGPSAVWFQDAIIHDSYGQVMYNLPQQDLVALRVQQDIQLRKTERWNPRSQEEFEAGPLFTGRFIETETQKIPILETKALSYIL
jgi:hypothetical protein